MAKSPNSFVDNVPYNLQLMLIQSISTLGHLPLKKLTAWAAYCCAHKQFCAWPYMLPSQSPDFATGADMAVSGDQGIVRRAVGGEAITRDWLQL